MTTTNLVQARFLFEKAQLMWEPYRDITNGAVVGLLQDSIELMLWAIIKIHSIEVKEKEAFTSLLDKICVGENVLQGKAHAFELNKARVNFKHYGLCPSSSDVPRFIENARFFLTRNSEEFLGVCFEDVSLADAVTDAELRELIKEAEKKRTRGELEEAIVHISLAFQKIGQLAMQKSFQDFPDLDRAHELFAADSRDEARFLLSNLGRFVQRFSEEYAMFTLGVDKSLLDELQQRRWVVNVSETGRRLGVFKGYKSTSTLENVNFLVSNVTEIARRL